MYQYKKNQQWKWQFKQYENLVSSLFFRYDEYPGIQSQRLRLEDEITNSKSRIKLPIPKVPTGIIKATGKNRTTKNNPGLILHRIPNSVRNESFTLFKTQAKHYHFYWIEGTS